MSFAVKVNVVIISEIQLFRFILQRLRHLAIRVEHFATFYGFQSSDFF